MLEKKPLVSVFIVTYNSQNYIIDALESVKSQTYKNIELVVSDDCSKDKTICLVKDWVKVNKERFVRVEIVENPINTGTAGNYNRAVKACRGEWLKMLDGDDLLLDNCIADNVDYVLSNPVSKIVFSDMYIIRDTNDMEKGKKSFNTKSKNFFKLDVEGQTRCLLKENILPSQTCFINASLLKNNPYNEKYRLLEDYPMWIHLSVSGMLFHYFDKCTAMYRQVDSVSSNSKELFPLAYVNICKQYYQDVVLPLIIQYNDGNAYNYKRKYYLWLAICVRVLRNRRNVFTVPICHLLKFFIFNFLSFKL